MLKNESTETPVVKPCPFCGSSDVRIQPGSFRFWVTCDYCEADGPINGDKTFAIRIWNEAKR